MTRLQVATREDLELLRSSAFESEHAWLYDTSYLQHEAAALALEQEMEQSHASISPDDNSDEQVRIIKTQITIHRERQRALRPHLESGSDQIDEEGNECVFVPAPNQWGANGDLDEESESLSAVRLCHPVLHSRGSLSQPTDMATDSKSSYLANKLLTSVLYASLRSGRTSLARPPIPLTARLLPS